MSLDSSVQKTNLEVTVKRNLFWRHRQLAHPPEFRITAVELKDQKQLCCTLDRAVRFKTSECLVSIHHVPGLKRQWPVGVVSPDQTECSINQKFTPTELQNLQQACKSGAARLTQDTEVDYSTELQLYEVARCNGSGSEVKKATTLKEWCARMTTHAPALSPANQHASFQQPPQQSPDCNQQFHPVTCSTPLPVLPSTVIPSNKRPRSGLDNAPQASSFLHYALLVSLQTDCCMCHLHAPVSHSQ